MQILSGRLVVNFVEMLDGRILIWQEFFQSFLFGGFFLRHTAFAVPPFTGYEIADVLDRAGSPLGLFAVQQDRRQIILTSRAYKEDRR